MSVVNWTYLAHRATSGAGKVGPVPGRNPERWHLKAGPCYIPGTTNAYPVGMEFRQSFCPAGGAVA